MKNLKKRSQSGFTLAELLIVVAIIAILVAVSIPIFTKQLENARNRTDAYNARVIEHAVKIYYMSHPEKIDELNAVCDASGSKHCAQIIVSGQFMSVPTVLQPALKEAGILGKPRSSVTFYGFSCESKENWKVYAIAFTTFADENGVPKTDDTIISGFLGNTTNSTSGNSWGAYSATSDPTPFRKMVMAEQ